MSSRLKGIILAIIGPLLWGVSGIVAEMMFTQGVSPEWLVGARLLAAGLILVIYGTLTLRQQFYALWRSWPAILWLIAFAVLGMLGSQFTYFEAIANSNAATATVLQFLSPTLVVLWGVLRAKRIPAGADILSIIMATAGTLLIATKGDLTHLAIAGPGLFWGLGAGVSAALCTLIPGRLIRQYGALATTSWAMMIGGVAFSLIHPIWQDRPTFSGLLWGQLAFVVVGGTLLAYLFYLMSLKYIMPTTTALLEAFEPLSAAVLSVVLLGMSLGWANGLGTLLIIGTVFVQTLQTPNLLKRQALRDG